MLYDTTHLPETVNMYYEDHHLYDFSGKVQDIFVNVHEESRKNGLNIVILDQSAFYPTSGGQMHDTGTMTIDGKTYDVVNVEKVGSSVLHILSENLEGEKDSYVGKEVTCTIDKSRRGLL